MGGTCLSAARNYVSQSLLSPNWGFQGNKPLTSQRDIGSFRAVWLFVSMQTCSTAHLLCRCPRPNSSASAGIPSEHCEPCEGKLSEPCEETRHLHIGPSDMLCAPPLLWQFLSVCAPFCFHKVWEERKKKKTIRCKLTFCARRVDPSAVHISRSSTRQSYISILFSYRFIST